MTIRNAILALLVTAGASFAVPWLGVTFKKATFENHLALDVHGVHPESGCFTAGMVAGDQIIGVQGQTLTDMSQIQSAVTGHKAGQKIKVEIAREGKKQTLTVALTERPDDISSLTGSAIGSKIAKFGENFYKNGEKRMEKPKATLLDFWATWCGPCQMQTPELEKFAEANAGKVKAGKVNVDEQRDLAVKFGVQSIPTILFIPKTGTPTKNVGAMGYAQLKEAVNEVLLK